MLAIQPASQHTVFAASQQVNVLSSAQSLQSATSQFLPLKQMSFGTSKKGRGLAAKYQELQLQQQQLQQQQLQQKQCVSQTAPTQAMAITVEMHPSLIGHLTPQQLAQIIPTANLNNNGPTTIIVDFNGQQLPIIVRTTPITSTNNASIVENPNQAFNLINNNVTNSIVQSPIKQKVLNQNNIVQPNISIQDQHHYDQSLNNVVANLSNFAGNTNVASQSYLKTNTRQKRNVSSRPSSSTSVVSNLASFSSTLTPTQSTSFDLDDTIESVCQQASLAAAASSRVNSSVQSLSVAAALQGTRSQTRRKPRSKVSYNGKI